MKIFSRLDLKNEIKKRYDKKRTVIDVSDIDTSSITNMSGVFKGLDELREIKGLENWKTDKVTDMSEMFMGCNTLKKLPNIANWNVGMVDTMQNMFYDCHSLESVSLSRTYVSPVDKQNYTGIWHTENLKYVKGMFAYCKNLQKIDGLSGLEVSNVEDMSNMFYNCSSLRTSIPEEWNMSQVTNISDMFSLDETLAECYPDAKDLQLNHYSELYNNPTLAKNITISNDDMDLFYNNFLDQVKAELEQEDAVIWEMEINDAIDLEATYDDLVDKINNSNTVNKLNETKLSIDSLHEWLPNMARDYAEEAFNQYDLPDVVSERVQDAIYVVEKEEKVPMSNNTREYLVDLLEQYELNHYAYDMKIIDSNDYCKKLQETLSAAVDYKLKHLDMDNQQKQKLKHKEKKNEPKLDM